MLEIKSGDYRLDGPLVATSLAELKIAVKAAKLTTRQMIFILDGHPMML
jgi:hypothetical protein